MKFKLPIIIGLAVISLGSFMFSVSASNEPPAPRPPAPGDNPKKPDKSTAQRILWVASYDEALRMASQQNKPVMADLYADWASASHYLDDHIFSSADVINESRKFINVRIDLEKQKDLAKLYKIYAVPTIIFMDGNCHVLSRIEGTPPKPADFIDFMQKAYQKFEAANKSDSHQ